MPTSKRLLACLGVICVGLSSLAPAIAEPLPECQVYTTAAGVEVCGFASIEDVKAIRLAAAELQYLREQSRLLALKVAELETQTISLRVALDAQRTATEIVRRRNVELTTLAIETDRRLQLERVKPRWGTPLAWGTAAVLGAVLLGVSADRFLP